MGSWWPRGIRCGATAVYSMRAAVRVDSAQCEAMTASVHDVDQSHCCPPPFVHVHRTFAHNGRRALRLGLLVTA